MKLRTLIKQMLPTVIVNKMRIFKDRYYLIRAYIYDYRRYFNYSRSYNEKTAIKYIGEIITLYHVIEKGLTMPNPRLGFGQEKVIKLCNLCIDYIKSYSIDSFQLKHAICVINEYEYFHNKKNYKFNNNLLSIIQKLKDISKICNKSNQKSITLSDYFKNSKSPFDLFSESRKSVRNFNITKTIDWDILYNALKLAQNSPSACNRQSWGTYIISDKNKLNQILELQGGNRGFGNLGDKLIIIVGEIGLFSNISERNQVFIDGGIYTMNLLYALHFYEIAACTLNCSFSPDKDIILRKICQIKESEVFIAMILCGVPPESFSITLSPRNPVELSIKKLD